MTEYVPIDCGLHSRYELWCMHRRWLRLSWRDANGAGVTGERRAVDLFTREGAEWLLVEDGDGVRETVRLDHIVDARTV